MTDLQTEFEQIDIYLFASDLVISSAVLHFARTTIYSSANAFTPVVTTTTYCLPLRAM